MTQNITKVVRSVYKVSEKEALGVVESVSFESSDAGSGKSATDHDVIKNPNRFTRRHMIFGGLGTVGLAGLALMKDAVRDAVVSTISEYATDAVAPFIDDKSFSFDPKFISFLHANRQHADLLSIVPGRLQDEEKETVGYLDTFRRGHYLNVNQAIRIRDMLRQADDPSTRLILADLLTSQLLRSGAAAESKRIFKVVKPLELNGPDERLVYVEKALSQQYTSLPYDLALSPDKWGMEFAIEFAQFLNLSDVGIDVTPHQRRFKISVAREITIPTTGPMSGIKGFYVIQILLLYWSANLPGSDLRHAAEIHMSALQQHVKIGGLQRAVWNLSFTIGLQFHRRGLASGNSFKEFALRDMFFDICVNRRQNFWPHFTNRLSNDHLTADDPAALCMAITIASDPSTGLRERYKKIASPRYLLSFREAVKSVAIRRAIDQARKRAGYGITDEESIAIYGADDGSLGIYLPPLGDIRSNIVL
ncbi:hypothetical protein [Rhizobium sp. Root1220]|uniref:hypothetical protein n=1 Tax=Rhizobium sp. Root1220 TaxID=1736432 RepID=UPI000AA7D041|nr:hypothetical protein [Rhizobium sp. Root1220]